MRELEPRRERARAWPLTLLLVVMAVAVAVLLWGLAAPRAAADSRSQPWLTALLIAVLLAASAIGAWSLYSAPRRLDYRLRGRTLLLRTLLGEQRVPLAAVIGAETIDFDLRLPPGARLGWSSSHLPGYYVGRWRVRGIGMARVVVAARRGRGVVLRFARGAPLLLAPRDPEALVARIESLQGRERGELRSGS